MESSVGANIVRAIRSLNRQKTAPPKKHPGITTIGFAVPKSRFTSCGTAIPTKDTGPAKAVTQADRMLESRISSARNRFTFTPRLLAYSSPSWYALMGFAIQNDSTNTGITTAVITRTWSQVVPEKLPMDQLWRFTIFESSANVTIKSVAAEQI